MRKSSKRTELSRWQITRIANKGVYLGTVEAKDADAAIKAAVKELDIEPQHRDRLAARQVEA